MFAAGARAGGHLDVDDAGTLDTGQCQYEAWYGRAGPDPVNAFHIGPACRVGQVELGLSFDRYTFDGQRADTLGPQFKWTWFGEAPDARFSGAVSANATWDRTNRGKPGRQLVLPFTWRALDGVQIHANLGADWSPVTGNRTRRGGLGTEWAISEQVSLLAERNRAGGLWTSRAGARLSLTPLISLDVTTSRTGPGRAKGFYVGLNHEFSR
ncbi:hypothetical protein AX767_14400 [Variovorax sp. PAMC 28711]|nr:hypothetical protein AX767_14400 [Variovorax sp. PAMC 28711]